MESVLEVLQKAEAYLERAKIENPKIDAQWLLAEALGCKRLELFLQYERPLDEDVLQPLRESVRRRARGEPLQYIIGSLDFHDIRLAVGPGVLVPRPETEQLVERVISLLQEWEAPRVVDLGTGSGAIALALAAALPAARILALDRSREALEQARANADRLGLRERVSFRKGDWLSELELEADCIVANPPYLTEEEWETARVEVREHEPREALVAADGGMADLKRILAEAPDRLAAGGLVALEMGVGHAAVLGEEARICGFREVTVEADDSGRDRFLIGRKGTTNVSEGR